MQNEPNQLFEFELCPRSGGSAEVEFSLRITDRASHLVILETVFDATQFANLMAGRLDSKGVPTWLLPEEYRSGIGMHKMSVSRTFSHEAAINEEALTKWAEDVTRFALPCQKVDGPRRRGGANGYQVSFVSMFATVERAEAWRNESQRILDGLPTPADLRPS